MKKTNNLIYVGFVIHIAITLLAGLDEEIILFFMAIPLFANLFGLYFLSFTNKIKLGAKIFMYSSFLFVPIGIIGVLGCRKVLDSLNEEEFFKEEAND
jgi:hypothetical protein